MLILTPSLFSLNPATPTSGLDWVRSPDGRGAAEHGGCAPSLLPADNDVILVLPPRAVSWHRAALPKVAAARLRAALDGVLEDQLLNDPAELHFAIAPGSRPGQTLWVAACDKAWLKSWLQVLDAAGRPITRIVPAVWPTSSDSGAPGETVHWAHEEFDGVWLATASAVGVRSIPLRAQSSNTFAGTATPSQGAAELSPSALDATATRWLATPSNAALAEQVFDQKFELMPSADWLLRCSQSDWNLAQFDLSLSSGARRSQKLRQTMREWRSAPAWRPARWGLGALLLSLIGGLNAMAWAERDTLRAKQRAVTGLLQTTFPDITVVVDAPAQMRRALTQLQQSSGTLSTDDLEAVLGAAASADSEAFVGSIDFAPGDAKLGAWNVPGDRLQAVQQSLNARGWQAELDNGTMRVRPKAPE